MYMTRQNQVDRVREMLTLSGEYQKYQPPFVPWFARKLVTEAPLWNRLSALNLGCGDGSLALALAPHVAALTSIGLEETAPEKIAETANITYRAYPTGEFRIDGRFDMLLLDRMSPLLSPHEIMTVAADNLIEGGTILVCGAGWLPCEENTWLDDFRGIVTGYETEELSWTADEQLAALRSMGYARSRAIETSTHTAFPLRFLLGAAVANLNSSENILGNVEQFYGELKAAMAAHEEHGMLAGRLHNWAHVYRRMN